MDEPTSSLTQKETDRLYEVIDDLKKHNVAVLYISHRLAEVKRVADRVTVLRDGRNAGELARAEISHDALVRLMVGRDLQQFYPRRHAIAEGAASRLEVRGLTFAGGRDPVSFEVRGRRDRRHGRPGRRGPHRTGRGALRPAADHRRRGPARRRRGASPAARPTPSRRACCSCRKTAGGTASFSARRSATT